MNLRLPRPYTLTLGLLVAVTVAVTGCGGGGDAASPTVQPTGVVSMASGPMAATTVQKDVVVLLRTGADVDALAASFGLQRIDQFGRRPIYRLGLPVSANVAEVVQALKQDARVLEAEANEQTEAPESRRARSGGGGGAWSIGESSTGFANQWVPQALRLDQAHALSRGQAIRVAVLDTGMDLTHPALAARLARDGTGNVLGRDFVDDDAVAAEEGVRGDFGYGHGTHVAGLVALAAPDARLMPVRVLDRAGVGNAWVLAEALLWTVDPDGNPATDDGAHVINLSLGTTRPTDLLRRAIALANCEFDDDDDDDDDFRDPGYDDDRARCAARYGAAVIAAVGNAGSETELQYPAAEQAPGALAIGASTQDRRLAAFSNRGSWVEATAPGESIISTVPGGGYGVWSGTSMAAPLAAGSAALLMATLPPSGDASLPTPRQWLATDVVKRLADRTAKLCGDTSLRQIDTYAALTDTSGRDPDCP
jgi:subtilisin family serine protease